MASTSGRGAYVGEPAYIASKWGVVGFAHSVRMEVAEYGIRVTLIEPGAHVWCNVAWVVFRDHILVLDAGRLSEAQTYLPIIQATADKPIRFVLNTHHHGDHSYGNEFWTNHGAAVMGNARIVGEFERDEPWRLNHFPVIESAAVWTAEVAATHVQPPSLLLSSPTVFDDGTQRVKLLHLGAAHTAADTLAWLPKQKILVTGDVVVNGPYNVMWDAHVLSWIDVLAKAEALGARLIVPGHGAPGPGSIIGDQQAYFVALRDAVKSIVALGEMRDTCARASAPLKSCCWPIVAFSTGSSQSSFLYRNC